MKLLGHNKSNTNEIYTHATTTKSIHQINSPFDDL